MVFYRVVPLSAGFMLTSILGAIISALYVYPNETLGSYGPKLGFTFFLFFTLMFIASIISMSLAPLDAEFDVKHERKKK